MRYLQVELTVSGELAEPVSEVLARHASGGVWLTAANSDQSTEADENAVTVRAYLPMDARLDDRRRDLEEDLWHLSQIQSLPDPSYEPVEEQDWSEIWKENYEPIEVGDRFLIQPAWMEVAETERLVILINPGMAFGTGTHPSTRLCLELLEGAVSQGDWMVDVGCGSGILSVAGSLLGAARVLALDVDPTAVEVTRENAARNGRGRAIEARVGSMQELLAVGRRAGPADVVAANLLSPALIEMLQEGLGSAVAADGHLILGGILEDQVSGVLEGAQGAGLRLIEERAQADWRALWLKRNPP